MQDAILRREGSLQAYAEVLISDFHRVGDNRRAGGPAHQPASNPLWLCPSAEGLLPYLE